MDPHLSMDQDRERRKENQLFLQCYYSTDTLHASQTILLLSEKIAYLLIYLSRSVLWSYA